MNLTGGVSLAPMALDKVSGLFCDRPALLCPASFQAEPGNGERALISG